VKQGKEKLIGLIVPDIQNPFYVDVVKGVEDYSYENDYAILMCNFAQDEVKEKLYIDLMKSESVGGLLLAPVSDKDEKVLDLVKNGVPIVCIDRGIAADVDIVVVNNREGAYNAVELLIKKGHKRIAYISGLPNIATSKFRREGYLKALEDYGIPLDEELIMSGNSKHESGKRLSAKLLDLKNPPTAFFTGNNLITLGALETIHNRGLKIPDEIAIVGFDDMPWSISLNPPLTAVSQPGYEIGRRSAELLIQRINDPSRESVKVELRTKLMIRKSC
jgi:LacI family transcriptional regulator/LacI family repressor for deo operon, udp, cdd, tsx, nupC, and nupG